MPQYRVCRKGKAPPEELTIEAADDSAAMVEFYIALCDWADEVELDTEEIREDEAK